MGSSLLAQTLYRIRVPAPGGSQPLQAWIYQTVFAPAGPPEVGSLLYALAWVAGWYLVLWVLYRRGIVWKV